MTARASWFLEKLEEIKSAADIIEGESGSFSEAFQQARAIQEISDELDTELRRLFTEVREFLRNIDKYGVNWGELEKLLYLLGE